VERLVEATRDGTDGPLQARAESVTAHCPCFFVLMPMYWSMIAIMGHRSSFKSWGRSMGYVDGFLLAAKSDQRETNKAYAEQAVPIFKSHGAAGVVECWGDDVPDGKVTSFPMAATKGGRRDGGTRLGQLAVEGGARRQSPGAMRGYALCGAGLDAVRRDAHDVRRFRGDHRRLSARRCVDGDPPSMPRLAERPATGGRRRGRRARASRPCPSSMTDGCRRARNRGRRRCGRRAPD